MEDKLIVDILAKPVNMRTLEERIILLEKDVTYLQEQNHMLRVSVTGAMSLSRQIEKQFEDFDKIITWHHKVINNNYSKLIGNEKRK